MNRVCLLLLFVLKVISPFAKSNDFKHGWDIKYLDNGIQFTSNTPAPIPFSFTKEPKSIILFNESLLDSSNKKTLNQMDKEEITGIRKELMINGCMETD